MKFSVSFKHTAESPTILAICIKKCILIPFLVLQQILLLFKWPPDEPRGVLWQMMLLQQMRQSKGARVHIMLLEVLKSASSSQFEQEILYQKCS